MKFVDMFCGIGTIRMGMEQAGHECVYSIEWDKHKRKIYKVVFGNEPEGSDIRRCTGAEIPAADIWCFGFPCQDISVAGKQLGLAGERSGLFYEVMRILQEIKEENRPKYLFIENVKNLLSVNRGLDFFNLLYTLDEVGYDAEWQLLNSKDFGVPQNRERVFIIANFRGRSTRKVFPVAGQSNPYNTIGKSAKTTVARTLTAGGHSGGNHSGMTILSDSGKSRKWREQKIFSALRVGGDVQCIKACLTPDREEKRQNGRRFKEPGEPMFTLTKQDIHGVECKGKIRRLTPKECWRLQGIPDEITDRVIAAGISDSQMYRGAGDACSVPVIYEIARRL